MRHRIWIAALATVVAAMPAMAQQKVNLGIVAFQMSSETHARVANAVQEAARSKGWDANVQNSAGDIPRHVQQVENLVQAKVSAIVVAMGKPIEADAAYAKAKAAGIPVISVMSGTSPHTLFDIQVNEYGVGATAALYLLGVMNYQGSVLTQRFENNVGTRIRGKVLDAVVSENTAVKVLGSHSMARTASWRDDVKAGMQALILQNRGKFQGIWASFDGQAYIIDDLLQQNGYKKGQVALVSIDGGPETYRRIADPNSLLLATVAIPFEEMGRAAADAVDRIVVRKEPVGSLVTGPYMYMNAILVDRGNVATYNR